MIKINADVIYSIYFDQYFPLSKSYIQSLTHNLKKHRRRIYADNDLLVERGAVTGRVTERINEELILDINQGIHRLELEQVSSDNQNIGFIISGLLVNDQVVPYTQDSFRQITFNID